MRERTSKILARMEETGESYTEAKNALFKPWTVVECGNHIGAACACGARRTRSCTFPLRGRKAGQICGKELCSKHAHANPLDPSDERTYCLAHRDYIARGKAP